MSLHFIPEGPPQITSITQTNTGFEARALCLVDGLPAEIRHTIENRRKEDYNSHRLEVFDAADMRWHILLNWNFVQAAHIPIHPPADTLACLNQLSETMWHTANVVTVQSRMRREDQEAGQYAA